ncbi:ATP-binding protein [Pseudidiomarina sediminum]|uniref:ATP-binding protein n=1 Tax=Pseudidiomarina sediminum TaxID=431675 RepID=UPI001C96D06C|nr:response regulator [Pseudidiomarina sediminum]
MLAYLLDSFTMLVLCVLCLFFCWLLYRSNRSIPGVVAWSLGTACFAIALIASSTLYVAPKWFGVITSNHLFAAAMVLQLVGLLTFFSRPLYRAPVIVGLICYSLLFFYFTYVEPSLAARIIVFSLNYIIYLGCLAYLFVTRRTPHYRAAASLYYVIAGTAIGLMLYRLWALFAQSSQRGDQLYDILVQLIHGLPFFISFAMVVVFFLLSNERNYLQIQQLQQAANQQAESKKHLLAFLSHEFRTPLNAIVGTAQLLAPQLENKTQQAAIERITSAGMELSAINQLILRQAEVEHVGEQLIKPQPTQVKDWLEELVANHRDSAHKKGLRLSVTLAETIPQWLMIDVTYLRHVLNNLIGNAIKYSDQGEVNLTVVPITANHYRFSVTDQGAGIPEDEHVSILAPFNRAWHGLSQIGSGLGLALVQQFLQSLGSNLKLQSSEGKGSVFSFELELATCESQAIPQAEHLQPLHLLIVEDIEINQHVAQGLLRKLGHSSQTVTSLSEAKQLLRQHYFDGVLLDLNLADGNGIDTFIDLKQEYRPLPPVILVTANVSQQIETEALQAGIVQVLHKPLIREDLALALTHHCNNLTLFDAEQFWQIAYFLPAQLRNDKMANLGDEFERLLHALLAFQRQDDTQQLKQQLHKIGSKATTLGFVKLAACCEQLSQSDAPQSVLIDVLQDLVDNSIEALQQQREEQHYG